MRGGIVTNQNGGKTRFHRFLGEQFRRFFCQTIANLLRERFSIDQLCGHDPLPYDYPAR
jgi:hypothetical protein